MIRDNYSNMKFFQAYLPVNTTGVAGNGVQIDLKGYEACTIVFNVGNNASVSTASYIDLILQHGLLESDAGASAWSLVPASQMIHSVYNGDSTTSTGLVKRIGDSSLGSATYIVGYKGKARYLRVRQSVTAAEESCLLGAVAILSYPANWPVNEPA